MPRTEAAKAARRKYLASPKGKAMIARCNARNGARAVATHKLRHPDRVRARFTASNALRAGNIVKQSCEVCGNPDSQMHHEDYSRPLDVRWRCFEHHLNEHNKRKVG